MQCFQLKRHVVDKGIIFMTSIFELPQFSSQDACGLIACLLGGLCFVICLGGLPALLTAVVLFGFPCSRALGLDFWLVPCLLSCVGSTFLDFASHWTSHPSLPLPAHKLDFIPPFTGGLVCQGTCMSDVPLTYLRSRLAEASSHLRKASELLAEITYLLPTEGSTSGSGSSDWIVLEPSQAPFPEDFIYIANTLKFRGVENGPGETPHCVLVAAQRFFSGFPLGPVPSAEVPFRAGFWASIALATHTPYSPCSPLCKGTPAHWVCLFLTEESDYCTSSEAEARFFVQDRQVVIQGLSTFTEVEIFCLGHHAPFLVG